MTPHAHVGGGHGLAVVIASSLAGLTAARALATFMDQVTVIERDQVPRGSGRRRGVPQARHTHSLTTAAQQSPEELIPGVGQNLTDAGAVRVRVPEDMLVLDPGGWLPRTGSDLSMLCAGRDLIDTVVRDRLRADAKVSFLQGHGALALQPGRHDTVTGVWVRGRDHKAPDGWTARRLIPADFVVDATGRGSHAPPWSTRYRRATEKPVAFRPEGAQPYDDRMLSWQVPDRTISIWTLSGRVKGVAFTACPEQLARLALYRKGESDLLHRDGMWFLQATCEIPEAEQNADPDGFLGIDLGIVNIATTSDGQIMAGRALNRGRLRERTLRSKLQKKNTPSAKRRLKKRQRKESRRARDINERVRLRRPQRATLHSWAFHQLGQFIAYKARKAGVPVMYVDPAYTAHLRRMRPHRRGEPGLLGVVRVPVLRIR